MTPDLGIMTQLLESFESAFGAGQKQVQDHSLELFHYIVGIEITLLGIYAALGGQEVATPMLKKILSIGFFHWVVKKFDYLTQEVLRGFTSTGALAGGGKPTEAILDPSSVLEKGFAVTQVVFEYMNYASNQTYTGFSMDAIICGLVGVLILLAFFLIALQIFITRLEFAMVVAVGLILIPFGVFKPTSFMAEKVFGAIFAFGVKVMVLTFIVSVAMPIMSSYAIPGGFVWDAMFNMLFAAATIACLAWHGPKVAAGFLSGSPALGGSGAVTGAAALATAFVGAAKAISAAIPPLAAVNAVAGGAGEVMKAATGGMGNSSTMTQGSSSSSSLSSQAGSGAAPAAESAKGSSGAQQGGLTSARDVKEGQARGNSGKGSDETSAANSASGGGGEGMGMNAGSGASSSAGDSSGESSAGESAGGQSAESSSQGQSAGSAESSSGKGGGPSLGSGAKGSQRPSSGGLSSRAGSSSTGNASKAGRIEDDAQKGGKGGNSSHNSSISNRSLGDRIQRETGDQAGESTGNGRYSHEPSRGKHRNISGRLSPPSK